MNRNQINAFFAAIDAADAAVQANDKAFYAWAKGDRKEARPVLAKGADTVVLGNVSVKLSSAPQSGRTTASRRNWKLDGKRATEQEVMVALYAIKL